MIKSYLLLPIALLALSLCARGQMFYTAPAPTISGISVSATNANDATIVWTTAAAANTTVEYGTTAAYGTTTNIAAYVTSHSIGISNLAASTGYHFRVSSTNSVSSDVSADQEFATPVEVACPGVATISSDGALQMYLGYSATYGFVGQRNYSLTTNHYICTVSFKMTKAAGDISTYNYNAKIYLLSGNDLDLGNLIGTSTSVLGTNTWSATSVNFVFSPSVLLNASTMYGVVVTVDTTSSGNCAYVLYADSGGTQVGLYDRWNTSGASQVAGSTNDRDCASGIYILP